MKIILTGAAGSGKDTVGRFIAEELNGVLIAQADPMKQFVGKIFGFDAKALWGPSEERNRPINMPLDELDEFWSRCAGNLTTHSQAFLDDVLPDVVGSQRYPATDELRRWFNMLRSTYKANLSARIALQTIGTEWGRKVRPTMWNEWVIRKMPLLLDGGWRYANETGLVPDPSFSGYGVVVVTDGRFRNEVRGVVEAGGHAIRIVNSEKEAAAATSGLSRIGVVGHRSEEEMKSIPPHWFRVTLINDKTLGFDVLKEAVVMALAQVVYPTLAVAPLGGPTKCDNPDCEACTRKPPSVN